MAGAACRVKKTGGQGTPIDVSGFAAWVEAWQKIPVSLENDGWVSSDELQEAWGCGYGQTLRRVKRLVADGAVLCERRPVLNVAGDKTMAVRYRLRD